MTVESGTIFGWIVSELSRIVQHSAGVREFLGGVETSPHTEDLLPLRAFALAIHSLECSSPHVCVTHFLTSFKALLKWPFQIEDFPDHCN